tara:strand:- start:9313 stop:9903 length:591 start_codon:yes stop_codon:yes gene_type:complete
MKKMMFLIFILVSFAFAKRDTVVMETLVMVTPESTLSVKGTTNINTFACRYNVNQLKNPIPVFFEKKEDKIIFKKTALILENACFDCGGKGINNDFQKLLKSEEHPKIYLFLKELETKIGSSSKVLAHVDIQIAGITNTYEIPVALVEENNMLISGNASISLKDFKMKPPKKVFGLIEVEDTIEIDFKLVVKEYRP